MKRRISRKLVWDDRGVSEVIGTILMLAITVVLFSSITVWVSNLPAPQGRVYVEFEGSIVPYDANDWSLGAFIELKHVGGMELNNWWTVILLKIDGSTTVLDMENSSILHPSLGDFWEVNEVWNYTVGTNILTEDSEVKINIIDQDVDTQVWEGTLMGTGTWYAPIIMRVWIDSDVATIFADPGPIEYGPEEFTVFAQIVDPEGDDPNHGIDVSTVNVSCPMLGWSDISMSDDNFDNIFTATLVGPDANYSAGYYVFICRAMDYSGRAADNHTSKFAVGGEIGGNPQIVVYGNNESATNIWTEPTNPLNGVVVQMYARIRNLGGAGALVDVKFYDGVVNDTNLITTIQPLINFGDYIVSTPWEAKPGGIHNITVNATVNKTWAFDKGIHEPDKYLNDNQNYTDIIVLPTILLVDDDGHINDESSGDTSSFMRASLEGSDFDYDFTTVSTGCNGPAFDAGDYRLEEYDIVIWMTGYETTNTIRADDIVNLMRFLNNSGKLWLIGGGAFVQAETDAADGDASLDAFFNTYLHTSRGPLGEVKVTDEPVWGESGHKVTEYFSEKNITLVEKILDYNQGYEIVPEGTGIAAFTLNRSVLPLRYLATSWENGDDEERILTQAFEFSMIEMKADMTQLTYKAITWLGNITIKSGRDLAVSEQYMSPSTVFYKQPVTITGVIRNNGFQNETYVNWSMTITDIDGNEIQQNKSGIIDGAPDPDNDGPLFIGTGQDNSVTITVMWTPINIGTHNIVFEVDPDNQIIETNENNNVLSDRFGSGDIDVQYIVLVVDDDQLISDDETGEVISTLDNLTYDYDLYNIALEGSSPGASLLDNYNAVIWVCGGASEPWRDDAEDSIQNYLESSSGRLWLTGENCLGGDIDGILEENIFQLNSLTTGLNMPSTLYGVDNTDTEESVSHGMKYETNGTHGCDILTNTSLSRGMFYQNKANGDFNGVCYDNTAENYRTVVNTFSLNSLNSSEAKQELAFLILHWFDKPDERTELRITDPDIKIRNSRGPMTHPQIGDAYILQATVYNPGGSEANFMVRFLDGDTQIGSDSIGIAANGKTTAEVVWIPLFAGQRTINVVIDPPDLHEADEIFETFNNYASKPIYVYFFWDDMENGTFRWSHSSTVMFINGESPLDYFTETEMYTDIATEWNETLSNNVSVCTDPGYFNSFDKAFWLQEPPGNMTGSSVTRSAVVDEPDAAMPPETRYMTDENVIINNVSAYKLDTIQTAVGETKIGVTGISNDLYTGIKVFRKSLGTPEVQIGGPDAGAVVITPPGSVLTESDGPWTVPTGANLLINESIIIRVYQEENAAPIAPTIEVANFTTEPLGADLLMQNVWNVYYWTSTNKVTGKTDGRFHFGSAALNSRIENFQYSIPNQPPTTPDNPYPANVSGGNPVDLNLSWECSDEDLDTIYYNVWLGDSMTNMSQIATDITTNYITVSGLFEDSIYFWYVIVNETYNTVVGPTWLFATGGPGGGGGNFGLTPNGTANINKNAVTEAVDLRNTERATLSFWHKYNLISGENGGVLMVGFKETAAGDYKYRYVIPSNTYTGSMNMSDFDRRDDMGTWIRWAWNGVSTRGTFNWEKVTMNILPYVNTTSLVDPTYNPLSNVSVKFAYYQYGSGSGYGWYIDDVRIEVSRADIDPTDNASDVWKHTDEDSHSGNWCWSNVDPDTDHMKPGIDNSLMTNPIDLTDARWAELSAYFKFNINTQDGAPPDGFRVEFTTDNGVHWEDMTLGVRSAWNVSGAENDASDGNDNDSKSYSGLNPDNYWVEAGTLTRLNIDLTPHIGKAIQIRFRVVTTLTDPPTAYEHFEDNTVGFGGFWVDDVIVRGETANVYG